ncbi:GcvT family protein [Rubrimonas cliftonensis]|nr:FAD-dependent oxidoreductase [Rubrimonas cliftonensis]
MKTQARAVIVGGGAVGCSIAYHLAKAGWTDIVLLERDELTAGSTWHAAGLLPLFNMSYAVSHIHDYSVKFYKTLEAETGLNPGFSVVGNLRMAQTRERIDEYRLYASTAESVGVPFEWMTPKEVGERWPLLRTDDLRGAIFHPTDGYINPADMTQAMAKGARQRGVEIVRRAQVNGFERRNGHWIVKGALMGEKGGNLVEGEGFEIVSDIVVTASGNHAQRTAAMIGCRLPAIPVEHQYIVTEPDSALVQWRSTNPEHPVLRDADAKWYVREERGGWILGPYEEGAPAWAKFGVPQGFRADLLPLDLERIEEEYASMLHRIPSSEVCGLKDDFNGPICYTPDGNPLVGPAPGVDGFWFAEGFSFGITAAGGTGHYLAQMITEGEAEIDMASLDPRRFGRMLNREYATKKNEETYSHVFVLHHPDEERPAARPLRTAPCYDRMKAHGAQFGQVNGWERPIYFAGPGFDDHASRSFRRGGWWSHAKAEATAIREGVGLIDATAFAKHTLTGPGAAAFLDWFTCNRLPKVGRISLTYALTEAGTVRSEYTIVRHAEDSFYLVSAGAAQAYDHDELAKQVARKTPEFGPMTLTDVTTQWGVFAVAGPKSRELLRPLVVDADPAFALSNKGFPWLSAREIDLGMVPTLALRVAYTGELGWELHHPVEMQNHLFDRLIEQGDRVGLTLVGARAQNWLRQEKSYRAWGADIGRDATPLESGLDRFVDLTKAFRGKDAMLAKGLRAKCVTILMDGPEGDEEGGAADPWGREALWSGDRVVGRLTSGGWSVAAGRRIGLGYVPPAMAEPGARLKVRIMGGLWDAEVVADSPHDPKNERIRADG